MSEIHVSVFPSRNAVVHDRFLTVSSRQTTINMAGSAVISTFRQIPRLRGSPNSFSLCIVVCNVFIIMF